ncbi:MAG TPA: glycosyltransferase [Rickettsiales bacterium]|nr:glycosyltransferase [Rickettsiales bacterium]
MKNYPKISVITPIKNAQETLEKAIKSLIAQNYPNLEYIVIDAQSTDETHKIIKKYEQYINTFISNDWNVVKAENEGIKIATGEIIAFLNADDFYEKNILLKVAEEFQKNDNLDIVSCLYRVIKKDENGNYTTIETSTQEKMQLEKNNIIISYGINARFFKKTIFEKYGFMVEMDEKNRVFSSNDVEHLIRIVLKGVKNKTINYVGYNYLAHKNSNTFLQDTQTKIILYEDRIFIAKMFLNSKEFELPTVWQKTFRKWLIKYHTRIVLYMIRRRKFRQAKIEFTAGVKDTEFFKFLFYLLKNLFRKL